jgi:hypothetical protein
MSTTIVFIGLPLSGAQAPAGQGTRRSGFASEQIVLVGNTVACPDACASMSVLDFQASKDFTADWDAWHEKHEGRLAAPDGFRLPVAVEAGEQIPYEAKAKEA